MEQPSNQRNRPMDAQAPDPGPIAQSEQSGTVPPRNRRLVQLSRALALALLLGGLGFAVYLRRSGFEWSVDALREWVAARPLAPLLYVLVFSVRTVLGIPSVVMMASGGALFGLFEGALWGTVGATLNAAVTFLLARILGRGFVERRMNPVTLQRIDAHLHHHGLLWIAAYTTVPVTPLSIAHLAAGLSGMRLGGFVLGSLIGMIPRTLLFSFLGDAIAKGNVIGIAVVVGIVLIAAGVVYRLRRVRFRAPARE